MTSLTVPRPHLAADASDRAVVGLTVVALAYLAAQAVLVGFTTDWRWDETIYLSQVDPRTPATFFEAHRARGITWVAWPIGALRLPLEVARGYVMVVSTLVLWAAFRPWVATLRWPAVAAAAVFATGWAPIYFGPEIYPNLLAGYAALGTVGALQLWHRRRTDVPLVAAALALAAVAWLRPTESVWVAAAVTPWLLVVGGRARWRPVLALLAGGFVGWLPWLVEAIVRYGGPLQRLADGAGGSIAGPPRNLPIQYLNLTEGPVQQVVADPQVTVHALAALGVLGLLGLLGLVQGRDRPARRAAWLALLAGTGVLAPYLLLNAGVNVRYLMPAMALYAIPVGVGVATLVRALRDAHARIAGVAALTVAVVFAGWQASIVVDVRDDARFVQNRPAMAAPALTDAADGRPCAFLTIGHVPELQYHSGCLGERLVPESPTWQCPNATFSLADKAEQGYATFVIEHREFDDAPHADWPLVASVDTPGRTWLVWQRPDDLGPTDPPLPAPPSDDLVPCPPSQAPDTSGSTLEVVWSRTDR